MDDPVHSWPPEIAPASTYTVGAWINGMSASKPLVRLSFDHLSIHVRAVLSSPISVDRTEATSIVSVSGLFSTGFQILTPTGRLDRVAIWCGGDVMADLMRRGWPVSSDPAKSIARKMFHLERWSSLPWRSPRLVVPTQVDLNHDGAK